ncbi:hypothetical protein [Nocardia sp. alder85J]|uniref:hypothetical protein n=1 Tax=Nocardia sp. alder85J TaxID=2862949 RepID=UPI001CD40CE7|nr:hypothetical protein [Nocardia sp. alder85J]MCX4097729.1 hypothetical protein [Nocardia sp. alder85J]
MHTISPAAVALINEWTETHAGGINPVHDAHDQAKLAALIEDMTENGWQGAPLVVDGEQALTGSHRYWAAIATCTEIPRIDVTDLCRLFDVDWDTHRDEHYEIYDAYRMLPDLFPADVVAYLGLDLH